ncbi:MAG TPA: hypothetical protein VFP25_00155, partial [Nitrososphaeraceae archaeon]|nr:hypothetical protein [Nitrososphaeraceae archaeon]
QSCAQQNVILWRITKSSFNMKDVLNAELAQKRLNGNIQKVKREFSSDMGKSVNLVIVIRYIRYMRPY